MLFLNLVVASNFKWHFPFGKTVQQAKSKFKKNMAVNSKINYD